VGELGLAGFLAQDVYLVLGRPPHHTSFTRPASGSHIPCWATEFRSTRWSLNLICAHHTQAAFISER